MYYRITILQIRISCVLLRKQEALICRAIQEKWNMFRGLQFLFTKYWNFLFEHIYLKYDVLVLLKQFIVSDTTWMKILLKKYVSVFQTTPSLLPTRHGRRIVPTTATHARQTIPTPTYWTVRAIVSLFHVFPAHWYWYNLLS